MSGENAPDENRGVEEPKKGIRARDDEGGEVLSNQPSLPMTQGDKGGRESDERASVRRARHREEDEDTRTWGPAAIAEAGFSW